MRSIVSAVVGLSLLMGSALAMADSKHFDPKVEATRKGVKLTFGLQSDRYKTHARVVVGNRKGGSFGPYTYIQGSVSPAYAMHISDAIHVPGGQEHVLEIDYDETPLNPGEAYDLTTIWSSSAPGSKTQAPEHVWGMSREGVTPVTFIAPERKAAAKKKAAE